MKAFLLPVHLCVCLGALITIVVLALPLWWLDSRGHLTGER